MAEPGTEPLRGLLAIYGPSSSGKTFSALRIAAGIVDVLGGKIALVDTELRGNLYHGRFSYDHYIMDPPFSPREWIGLYNDLDRKYSVIITDSFSDEYEGPGGISEMAAMSPLKNDIAKWAQPKAEHKQLMSTIRRLKSQHIFCLRASDKIEIYEGEDQQTGRLKKLIRPLGWQPHAEKNFRYDVTLGWGLPPDSKGVATVWKTIDGFDFQDGEQLSEDHGRRIAAWIKGEAVQQPEPAKPRLPDMLTIRHGDQIIYQGKDASAALAAYGPVAKELAGDPGAIANLRVANFRALEAMLAKSSGKRADYLKGELAAVS